MVYMTWSIDGEDSAPRCTAHGAAQIEITITSSSGSRVDTLDHRCFVPQPIDSLDRSYIAEGVGVTLPIGHDYLASARLVDANHHPVTRAVTVALSPGVLGPKTEPNFEFGGTFMNGP